MPFARSAPAHSVPPNSAPAHSRPIQLTLALVLGCLVPAAPAHADPLLNFVFTGSEIAHFVAPSDPTPDFSVSGSLTGLDVPYATNGTTSNQFVTFYNAYLNGGALTPASLYTGAQLYTGSESAPTFHTGTYALSKGETLTVTPVQQLLFTLSGPENAHFSAPSDPTPDLFVQGTLTGLELPYTTGGKTSEQSVTFYNASLGSSVFTPANLFFGPQIYLGPENSPTFVPGTFHLSGGETLTVTAPSTPTPEPATITLLGTGLAGIAHLLRRKTPPQTDL